MNVEIYVRIGDNEFKRLDLFKDEVISISDSIQNIRDIQKVFVPYTSNIVVPASKVNNTVFKHYYNNDIDGFDGRFLVDAYITIDGYLYKEGKVRLEKAVVRDNEVYSYNIRFFGETIELTELIGDDELRDLDLSQYNFDFTADLVKSGFTFTGDNLTWPFISSQNYYYYATGVGGSELMYGVDLPDNARNKNVNAEATFHGVDYLDLKPAIKVDKLIRAIEAKYGIKFTNHFFDVNDPKWEDLHMWLDREKGQLLGNTLTNGELRVRFDDSEIATLSATDIRTTGNLSVINKEAGADAGNTQFYLLRFGASVDADDVGKEFTIEVVDGLSGVSLTGVLNRTGKLEGDLDSTDFVRVSFEGYENANGDVQPIIIIRSAEVASVKFSNFGFRKNFYAITGIPPLRQEQTKTSYAYQYNNGAFSELTYTGVVSELVPEFKVIDFLTSIFKTFNLTAYKNEDGEIEVKSLGEYYNSGSILDLTEYVDSSNVEYERSTLYKTIELKNKDPKTWATKQFDNIFTGDSFGDFEINFEDRNTFTKDYKLQTNFGRIIYERMSDQADLSTLSDIQWGWAVGENKDSVQTDPTLVYCTTQSVDRIVFDDGTDTPKVVYRYVKPSNVHPDTGDSLSFGVEVDEWVGSDANTSLYESYYKDYIEGTFDIRSRIVKIKAKLPSTILLNYKLNDLVLIEGKEYTINTLSANLSTGETELELLTKI